MPQLIRNTLGTLLHWYHDYNALKPLTGPDGTVWHFALQMGFESGKLVERVFFWDADRRHTGIMEFAGDGSLHIRRLRDRMRRLTRDPAYRARFAQPLRFPVERHY